MSASIELSCEYSFAESRANDFGAQVAQLFPPEIYPPAETEADKYQRLRGQAAEAATELNVSQGVQDLTFEALDLLAGKSLYFANGLLEVDLPIGLAVMSVREKHFGFPMNRDDVFAALLTHDVGKTEVNPVALAISASGICWPKWVEAEFLKHPEASERILAEMDFSKVVQRVGGKHHFRQTKGRPYGSDGELNHEERAVCDVVRSADRGGAMETRRTTFNKDWPQEKKDEWVHEEVCYIFGDYDADHASSLAEETYPVIVDVAKATQEAPHLIKQAHKELISA